MKRTFTVSFGRSVNPTSGKAQVMTVLVQSLTTASSLPGDVTFPTVRTEKKIKLSGERNLAVFELEPSYMVGLDRPILYRVSWRLEFLGRVESTDFTMPNADITYDDLFDIGAIVGSEAYLQEEDLGKAGRVAKLNDDGLVVDAAGHVVSGGEGVAGLEGRLSAEISERKTAVQQARAAASSALDVQITAVTNTTATKINTAITEFRTADLSEKSARETAVNSLNTTLQQINTLHVQQINDLTNSLNTTNQTMVTKADLVNGKIPTSQIPNIALGTAISVASEAAMLALTSAQVQQGDFAIRPDSTWILVSSNPANLASWSRITTPQTGVTSVNGQTGSLILSATDVGARPLGTPVPLGDVSGLTGQLADKLTQADLSSINLALGNKASIAQLDTLRTEAVLKSAQGLIPTALLGLDVPLVNALGQLVKKDGTVISTGGGSGGGAVASVNGKIGTVLLSAADVDARSVTTKVPLDDVAGLTDALAGKATTGSVTSLVSRLTAAESDIDALQANGGGGGGTGGSSRTSLSWLDDGTDNVAAAYLRSPFGRNAQGQLYYNHLGAADGEALWPYVGAGGNLSFRKVVPGAAADPEWGTKAALDALTQVVQNKAEASAVASLTSAVESKASQNDLNSLVSVVQGKVSQADFNVLSQTVSGKASQSSVDSVNSALQSKVDTSTFNDRASSVDQQLSVKYQVPVGGIPLATMDSTVQSYLNRGNQAKTAVDAASATGTANALVKTDANGTFGVNPATANAHPYRKDQVDSLLAGKATTSDINTALSGKADLVGGKLPTSQLPALATHETYAVANRGAMLALTQAQVQIGDAAIITAAGTDQGTYTLIATDPAQFSSWLRHQAPPDAVTSVNGQTSTVVLSAADIGARAAGVAIAQSEVTGLAASLAAKADTTYVNQQISTRTTPTQVAETVAAVNPSKLKVKYAATAAVASLSGLQSIDGVLGQDGDKVLLPLQNSSIQNGIWVMRSAGAWTRPADAASGSTLLPGTIVAITSGSTNADSLWQVSTASSSVIDSTSQNWEKILRGGLPVQYAGSNTITVDQATKAVSVRIASGLISTTNGLALDTTNILRKFVQDIPAGNTSVTVAHGLNTFNVVVQVRDKTTGDLVDIGPTVISAMAISVEFDVAPDAGRYDITVFG